MALAICVWCLMYRQGRVNFDLCIVLFSNCTALIPLVCLAANLLEATFRASFPGVAQASVAPGWWGRTAPVTQGVSQMETQGNEVTLFIALAYAAMLIVVSLYRNLRLPKGE